MRYYMDYHKTSYGRYYFEADSDEDAIEKSWDIDWRDVRDALAGEGDDSEWESDEGPFLDA
jgi:hypothetical protein